MNLTSPIGPRFLLDVTRCQRRRFGLIACVILLAACGRGAAHTSEGHAPSTAHAGDAGVVVARSTPQRPIGGRPSQTWVDATQARIEATLYAPVAAGGAGMVTAENSAHGMSALWTETGVAVRVRGVGTADDLGRFELGVAGVGRGTSTALENPSQYVLGNCDARGALTVDGECAKRVERRSGDIVEWFQNGPDGLEHGWEVARRPEGVGPMRVSVRVAGASVTLDADGLGATLRPSGARIMRYVGLRAWDAAGNALNARLVASAEGLTVEVDDASAAYPVTVDPLLTSVAWTADGTVVSEQFGYSISAAGDVNGDQIGDLIVGTPRLANGAFVSAGAAFLFLGTPSGLSTTPAWTVYGAESNALFGCSVAGVGDINGDGF